MFLKIESPNVAEQLAALGFSFVTEEINKKVFYCFNHTPELAKIIMDKFADTRLIIDGYLHF